MPLVLLGSPPQQVGPPGASLDTLCTTPAALQQQSGHHQQGSVQHIHDEPAPHPASLVEHDSDSDCSIPPMLASSSEESLPGYVENSASDSDCSMASWPPVHSRSWTNAALPPRRKVRRRRRRTTMDDRPDLHEAEGAFNRYGSERPVRSTRVEGTPIGALVTIWWTPRPEYSRGTPLVLYSSLSHPAPYGGVEKARG